MKRGTLVSLCGLSILIVLWVSLSSVPAVTRFPLRGTTLRLERLLSKFKAVPWVVSYNDPQEGPWCTDPDQNVFGEDNTRFSWEMIQKLVDNRPNRLFRGSSMAAEVVGKLDFSCVVVGSSGSLLSRPDMGVKIDSHDVILRVNEAPSMGYEAYVGSRTDLRVVNTAGPRRGWLALAWPRNGTSYKQPTVDPTHAEPDSVVPEGPSATATSCITAQCIAQWSRALDTLTNDFVSLPNSRPHFLLHPASRCYLQSLLNDAQPSAGLTAVFLALSFCPRVSVVGFASHEYAAPNTRARYFDPSSEASISPGKHRFDTETNILQYLAYKRNITILN